MDADALIWDIQQIENDLWFRDKKLKAKERKRQLASLEKSALSLKKRIDKIPSSLKYEIHEVIRVSNEYQKVMHDDLLKSRMNFFNFLDSSLQVLALASQAGLNKPQSRKQSVKIEVKDELILMIAKSWERLSGKPATYTTDTETSERRGDFIQFLKSVGNILGVNNAASLPERFCRLKRKHGI